MKRWELAFTGDSQTGYSVLDVSEHLALDVPSKLFSARFMMLGTRKPCALTAVPAAIFKAA